MLLHVIITVCIIMNKIFIEDERDINISIRNTRLMLVLQVEMTINKNVCFEISFIL